MNDRRRPAGAAPETTAKSSSAKSIPWPLPTAVLDRRRAARQLDELLTGELKYPDVEQIYPRRRLIEAA